MIGGLQFDALFRKELIDLSRNRDALLPLVLVTLVVLALPFAISVVIPEATGQRLGGDPDLVRVSEMLDPRHVLSTDGRIQLFFFQQFLMLFLLTPITGAMALAAHAVVGE